MLLFYGSPKVIPNFEFVQSDLKLRLIDEEIFIPVQRNEKCK